MNYCANHNSVLYTPTREQMSNNLILNTLICILLHILVRCSVTKFYYHKHAFFPPDIPMLVQLKTGLFLLNVFTDPLHTILEETQNKIFCMTHSEERNGLLFSYFIVLLQLLQTCGRNWNMVESLCRAGWEVHGRKQVCTPLANSHLT